MPGRDKAKKIAVLGCLCGITSRYWDNFGRLHHTSPATNQALLSAMGVPWEDPAALDQEIARRRLRAWGTLTAPVEVIAPAPATSQATLRLWSPTPEPPATVEVQAELVAETGDRYQWEKRLAPAGPYEHRVVPGGFRIAVNLPLPANLELGYYDLTLMVQEPGRKETGHTKLIAAPPTAYSPERLARGDRLWGFNLPLYAVRSRTNWGIGDFTDLTGIMRWAGDLGAAFVGINPLHAFGGLAGADPSPYSPASRIFHNILYLSLEIVPEMADCREARDLMASPEFQAEKSRLVSASLVAYREVYRLKQRALRLLYETFCRQHGDPGNPRTARGQEFARFVAAKGGALAKFGQFGALADHFQKGDWRRWPEAYRDPEAPAVAEFAREHPQDVGLAQYGQWLVEAQQGQACRAAQEHGLAFSLYEDMALGVNPGGFETWAHQDLFALGAATGAPPELGAAPHDPGTPAVLGIPVIH